MQIQKGAYPLLRPKLLTTRHSLWLFRSSNFSFWWMFCSCAMPWLLACYMCPLACTLAFTSGVWLLFNAKWALYRFLDNCHNQLLFHKMLMIFVVLDQHTELNIYSTSSMTEVDMSLHSQIHNVVLNNRLMHLNHIQRTAIWFEKLHLVSKHICVLLA